MELSLEALTMGLAVANDRYRNAVDRGNPIQAERLLRQVDEIEARIEKHLEQRRAQRGDVGSIGAGDAVSAGNQGK